MFFTRKKLEGKNDGYGRLYVIKFEFDGGLVLHKVGMCNTNRTLDRLLEILRSFFVLKRYMPRVTIRKDKKTIAPLLVEKHMHGLLDEWNYDFGFRFDGSTEFFHSLDEEVLFDYLDNFDYRELLRTTVGMKREDYDAIKGELATLDQKKMTKKEKVALDSNEIPF